MKVVSVMLLVLVASACGVTTDVLMLDPAAPIGVAVPTDSVRVFAGPANVLVDYEPIATITAGSRSSGTGAPDESDVIDALKTTAGGLGADGLILGELRDQQPASASENHMAACLDDLPW